MFVIHSMNEMKYKVKQAEKSVVGYYQSLEERWDKPENIEQYLKNVEAAKKYAEETGDDKLLKKVTKQGYKKSWWDKNPFKGDLLSIGVPTVLCFALFILVIKANRKSN